MRNTQPISVALPHDARSSLGGPSKQASRHSRLAIHNRRRPRQTQEALPPILSDSGD